MALFSYQTINLNASRGINENKNPLSNLNLFEYFSVTVTIFNYVYSRRACTKISRI